MAMALKTTRTTAIKTQSKKKGANSPLSLEPGDLNLIANKKLTQHYHMQTSVNLYINRYCSSKMKRNTIKKRV